ncbi:MAG: hypothetical protein QOE73_2165, partial [Verrucomicrobiota bacterium]
MPSNSEIRPWMLAYTIVFGLLSILFVHDDFAQYAIAYTVVCGLMYAVIFAGNLLYSLGLATPSIRVIWKFIFPLVILHFLGTGIIDARFGKHAHESSLVFSSVLWVIGFALFFPTFRAHFWLGYGRA